ncbi:MAG: F0F1 ATP synthase subunit delta [Bacilli bacterium]
MSVVASRYSEALYELALEENCLESIFDSYKLVNAVFTEQKDLIEVLSHPEIILSDKIDIVRGSFSEVNINLLNFICVLIEKDRLREIFNIFEDFEILYNIHFNISIAKVYSTTKLDDNQLENLKNKLSKKINKKIEIKNIIDKELIGGIKIMIDNHVIDYSLKTKINNLSEELHKIQIR